MSRASALAKPELRGRARSTCWTPQDLIMDAQDFDLWQIGVAPCRRLGLAHHEPFHRMSPHTTSDPIILDPRYIMQTSGQKWCVWAGTCRLRVSPVETGGSRLNAPHVLLCVIIADAPSGSAGRAHQGLSLGPR